MLPPTMSGLYRDASTSKTILVDGIICSLFEAFSRYGDTDMINDSIARSFKLDSLKQARVLLYKAFELNEPGQKLSDKKKEETLLKDIWEKITKIDRTGHDVIVAKPQDFPTPQFLSDADVLRNTRQEACYTLLMEKMATMEKEIAENKKKIDENEKRMTTKLVGVEGKIREPPSTSPPASTPPASSPPTSPSYAEAMRRPDVKTIRSHGTLQNQRSSAVNVITGSRKEGQTRRMKSPPVDIFVYHVPKGTSKQDIVEDLKESEILLSESDISLMSKGENSVVSFKISVKAEDFDKALDPCVWPLGYKVRRFIHYKRHAGNMRTRSHPAAKVNPSKDELPIVATKNRFQDLADDINI